MARGGMKNLQTLRWNVNLQRDIRRTSARLISATPAGGLTVIGTLGGILTLLTFAVAENISAAL